MKNLGLLDFLTIIAIWIAMAVMVFFIRDGFALLLCLLSGCWLTKLVILKIDI